MPVVTIPLANITSRIARAVPTPELEALLEQLGCDVEEFGTVRRLCCLRCGAIVEIGLEDPLPATCPECGAAPAADGALWRDDGTVEVVRMDLLPIRPDIFDEAGLARALRGLLEEETGAPVYPLVPSGYVVEVDPAMEAEESYRPFVRCAVVRGLTLDDLSLRTLMKLQELLHWALGRNRKLASIGVYDLACIRPRIRYTAVAPDELRFVPLQSADGRAVTPREILTSHPKGVAYANLLAKLARWPLLVDEGGQVLSLPPIINSHETRLTTATTDVFIDVTGVGERAVDKSLATIVTSILELFPGARAETVAIQGPRGTIATPDFAPQHVTLTVREAEGLIGIPLDADGAARLLRRMRHDARPAGDRIEVDVPAYRNDIMHPVDLCEDIAIAYGYHNIEPRLVPTMTVAVERPERVLANRVRAALTGLGFFETMSLLLTNPESQYGLLGLPNPGDAIQVEHPVSVEQSMLRTRILPMLLELFALNRGQGLPQRLFEVDDVVRRAPSEGHELTEEALHVAAGVLGSQVGFADAKALAEALARELGMPLALVPTQHPGFIAGRTAALHYEGRPVGICGEVHPEVLERLRLVTPLVALELDLEPLLARA